MKFSSSLFLPLFSQRSFCSSSIALKQIPSFWKQYQHVTLFNRESNYVELYQILKNEIDDLSPLRSSRHVIYSSGMSKIGKTAFGLNAPSKLLEISRKKQDNNITKILEEPIYLLIDANGRGDGYSEEDMNMREPYCLGWRLLARACGIAGGVAKLRGIIQDKKISKYIKQKNLKRFKELTKLLLEIKNLNSTVDSHDVILALAKDYRSIKQIQKNENVTIFVHHDEHQLIFEKRKALKKLQYSDAIDYHKEYLYDLCTMRADGIATWCRNNNITLFPIFTGTSGSVLLDLIKPTQFTKRHIFLDILDNGDSIKVMENTLKSFQIEIHNDWKEKKQPRSEYFLSPLDVIISELGGIPGIIKNASRELKEILAQSIENTHQSILQANKIIQTKLQPNIADINEKLLRALTFLSLTGITIDPDFKIDGMEYPLSRSEIHGLYLFRPDKTNMNAYEIYIPPCHLLKMYQKLNPNDRDLVKYYEEFLNLESTFKTPEDYGGLFEQLNANRILLYLHTLQNILNINRCSIHQLFQTTKQNDVFKNLEINIDLKKLDKIDSPFLTTLDEPVFEIDQKTRKAYSCLTKHHKILENKKYGIYLLPKHHPRFDILLKFPCAENEKFDEIHIFIQTKTSKSRYYVSSSQIKTPCHEFIEALHCYDESYKKLTDRRILTAMILIDSRYVKDIESMESFINLKDYPCKIITFDELQVLFPNFSHRFLMANYKDTIPK